jgi:hypothetical protein
VTKYLRKTKEEGFIFAHGFRPWLVGPIMAARVCGREDFSSHADRMQTARQEGTSNKTPPRTVPITYFLQLGPTS